MKYLRDAWLVLVLAVVFGGALAGVQATLSGQIDANKAADAESQVPLLVAGSARSELAPMGDRTVYQATDGQGRVVGWVVRGVGMGFADKVELLVGVNADATRITGLYVLDQKETPGLGNKVIQDGWRKQFAGLDAAVPVTVTKAAPAKGNQVIAVTGATISSQSVSDIVNTNVQWLRGQLAQRPVKG